MVEHLLQQVGHGFRLLAPLVGNLLGLAFLRDR
jgi:hypothetical protein